MLEHVHRNVNDLAVVYAGLLRRRWNNFLRLLSRSDCPYAALSLLEGAMAGRTRWQPATVSLPPFFTFFTQTSQTTGEASQLVRFEHLAIRLAILPFVGQAALQLLL